MQSSPLHFCRWNLSFFPHSTWYTTSMHCTVANKRVWIPNKTYLKFLIVLNIIALVHNICWDCESLILMHVSSYHSCIILSFEACTYTTWREKLVICFCQNISILTSLLGPSPKVELREASRYIIVYNQNNKKKTKINHASTRLILKHKCKFSWNYNSTLALSDSSVCHHWRTLP